MTLSKGTNDEGLSLSKGDKYEIKVLDTVRKMTVSKGELSMCLTSFGVENKNEANAVKKIEQESGHSFEIDTIFFNQKRRSVSVLELKSCEAVVENNNALALLVNLLKGLKQCDLDEKYLTGAHILDLKGAIEYLRDLKSKAGNWDQFRK